MTGYIDVDRENFHIFRKLPEDGPIHMLNLLRFHDEVTAPDGTTMSGRDAYARYGALSGETFRSLGGEIIWSAGAEVSLIGAPGEVWHKAFVAQYPSIKAFMDMQRVPDYAASVAWRQAALADSRLIATRPANGENEFG